MSRDKTLIGQLEEMLPRLSPEDRATVVAAIAALRDSRQYIQRTPQVELYEWLFALGVDVRMEVMLPSRSPRSRSGTFRADLVVYKNGIIVALCECKSRARDLTGRQREHYDGSGYPYIVAGRDTVDEAFAWLVERAHG